VKLSENINEKPASSYAVEGTLAHEIAEHCLRENVKPQQCSWVDSEMAENLSLYVDYVQGLQGVKSYEVRVDFSPWVPDGFGTCDALIISDGCIEVVDLKYGMVRVDPFDNPQLMLYALGAYYEYSYLSDITSVKMTIVQPRLGNIESVDVTLGYLLRKGEEIKQGASRCFKPNPELVPTAEGCKYCPAKLSCPALLADVERTLMSNFDDLTLVETQDLTLSKIKKILDGAALVRDFLNSVEELAFDLITKEKSEIEGWCVADGRGSREWIDEGNTAELLEKLLPADKVYAKKIVSPAQAEKLVRKEDRQVLDSLIHKKQGKPTLKKK
jgi:hypothetical protein